MGHNLGGFDTEGTKLWWGGYGTEGDTVVWGLMAVMATKGDLMV